MSSGVKVSDEVLDLFMKMKLKKKHRYMLMIISGEFIIMRTMKEKTDSQEDDFDDFISQLPRNECCYAVLDLDVPCPTGQDKELLFRISWCPDTATIKDKMMYASSLKALNERLREGTKAIQANDINDLNYRDLLQCATK